MTIETGALEQAYAKVETAFNVTPADALAGSDGIRHLSLALSGKNNREPSPEKRGTPDVQRSLPRRFTANWNLSSIMWEPSGTLGTVSDVGKFLKAGMGASHVIAAGLTTTVAAAPAPTATVFTLTSATGLAVGDLIAVMVGTALEVTKVTAINASEITVHALSAAPAALAAVYAGVTYSLANNITESLAIYKYYNAGSFKQAAYGSVVDQIQATFDGTREVQLALQGPAADYADSSTGGGTVQAKPGTHVTVGNPAQGMVGSFYVDGNEFLVISAQLTINNNLELRNKELGTAVASGIAGRANMRQVGVNVTCYLEDLRLLGMAHSVTRGVLRLLIGDTNGSLLGMVAPAVEFEIPDVGDEIGPKEITISGQAYATSGNDQVTLGEI